MEQRKSNSAEQYYYWDKLKHNLEKMRLVRTAVVEAPSGYGKTTAIRNYFVSRLPQGTPVYRFTGADEAPASATNDCVGTMRKLTGMQVSGSI